MPLDPFEEKLAAAWPPGAWQDVTVLVAVSGGADSVALLRAMRALKTAGEGRLIAAHLNHQLREKAAADEAAVVAVCRSLGVPCEVGRAQIAAAQTGDGLEAAARQARYEFLEATAGRVGARYVVTAHTADDQAETILHRILRGTGIRGLSGMARARPLGSATLIRPLLGLRRVEILAYLDRLGQPYRHDSSNADPRFTRNRIRLELLPQLAAQYNPSVVEALLRLGMLAGEVQTVVDALVDDLYERCVRAEGLGAVRVDARMLAAQPRYVVRELLATVWRRKGWPEQAMGFAQWDLLGEMASTAAELSVEGPWKQMFPGGVVAEVGGTDVLLMLHVREPPPGA